MVGFDGQGSYIRLMMGIEEKSVFIFYLFLVERIRTYHVLLFSKGLLSANIESYTS